MTAADRGEAAEPPGLRRLRRLVTLLTATLIVGIAAIVVLLAIRLTSTGEVPALPTTVALPPGERAGAVTFGSDWLAVVTVDDAGRERIRILDRATGAERGMAEIAARP